MISQNLAFQHVTIIDFSAFPSDHEDNRFEICRRFLVHYITEEKAFAII